MYCCFTGHRRLNIDDRLKEVLSDVIDTAIKDGFTDFYCGMAMGIDMCAAEILIEKIKKGYSIRLHAALPCPKQDLKWSDADKSRYEKILSYADSKTIISPFYTRTCMLTRNRFMVDNSQRVIAVWSGFPKSGTAYTVRYAKSEHKEIHLIRPKDLSVSIL